MARKVSSNPADSTADLGFEAKNGGHSSGARKTAKGSPQGERGGWNQYLIHKFPTLPDLFRTLLHERMATKTCVHELNCF